MRFKVLFIFVCRKTKVKFIMTLVKSAVADQVPVYKLMANMHENGTSIKFSVTPSETVK